MAFRWFKKHEKTFMLLIAVFIIPTFGVSYAAFLWMGRTAPKERATFELVPGETVKISVDEFRSYQRQLMQHPFFAQTSWNPEAIYRFMIELDEARLAGLRVSDAELASTMEYWLSLVFPAGYTLDQYKQYSAQYGLTVRQMEQICRDYLLVQKIEMLKGTRLRVPSLAVCDAYADDNVRATFDYVKFSADDFTGSLSEFDFTPEEVEAFWERAKGNPVLYAWVVDKFRMPERYRIDCLFVAVDDFDPEAHAGLLDGSTPPGDDRIRAYYDAHLDWFRPESTGAEEPGDGEESEGDDGSDAEPKLPDPRPLDEVKDEIRQRIEIEDAFARLLTEIHDVQDESSFDLAEFAQSASVGYMEVGPLPAEEIVEELGFGDDDLVGTLALLPDKSFSEVGSSRTAVYLLRVLESLPADFQPLTEINLALRKDLIRERAREEAQKKAEEFFKEVDRRTEELVKGDQKPKDEGADESDEGTGEGDGSEMEDLEAQISAQELMQKKRPRMHEAFDALVAEEELEVKRIGPMSWVPKGSEELEKEEDPARRHLRSVSKYVYTLDEGQVEYRSLNDAENFTSYVVKLVKKEKPSPDEMTQEDFDLYTAQKRQRQAQVQRFSEDLLRQVKLQAPGIDTSPAPPGMPGGLPPGVKVIPR